MGLTRCQVHIYAYKAFSFKATKLKLMGKREIAKIYDKQMLCEKILIGIYLHEYNTVIINNNQMQTFTPIFYTSEPMVAITRVAAICIVTYLVTS